MFLSTKNNGRLLGFPGTQSYGTLVKTGRGAILAVTPYQIALTLPSALPYSQFYQLSLHTATKYTYIHSHTRFDNSHSFSASSIRCQQNVFLLYVCITEAFSFSWIHIILYVRAHIKPTLLFPFHVVSVIYVLRNIRVVSTVCLSRVENYDVSEIYYVVASASVAWVGDGVGRTSALYTELLCVVLHV